jgi:Aspartyl protease
LAYRPRKERIAAVEQELAKETDKKEREAMQKYLDFLRAAEKQPHTCQLATKVTETQVPLKVLMPDPQTMQGVEVKVTINGKVMNLLLDTGASGILIKKLSAGGVGLVPAIETRISGTGDEGALKGYIAYAESIKVGALEFQNCTVDVADTRNRSILSDIDGVIGADVFSSYLVSIDFPGERLTLKPLPKPPGQEAPDAETLLTATELSEDTDASAHDRYIAPELKSYTPFFRFGHYILIPTRVGDTDPKLFMIDSGAMWSNISPEAAREVTSLGYDLDLRVEGVSGEVKNLARAHKAVLHFGHVAQENRNMWAMDESHISRYCGVEVSGTLGYTALAFMQMDIDYRDGLVNFTYDPKKYRPLMRWKQQGKD